MLVLFVVSIPEVDVVESLLKSKIRLMTILAVDGEVGMVATENVDDPKLEHEDIPPTVAAHSKEFVSNVNHND